MPHPPVYNGTQDDDRTRSIDVVHIEPSIREGTFLVSSLYGPEASAPLYRYPPTNTVDPWISGDTQIPNILTCNEGQWLASPAAIFAYQWMSNGVDLPGETNRTYTTDETVDNTTITCEVRGYNSLGEAYALTAGVDVSLIEPIITGEMEDYFISGLSTSNVETTHDERTMVVTGMSSEITQEVMRSVSYFMSGRSADKRQDMNMMYGYAISGTDRDDNTQVHLAPGIAIVNWDTGAPFVDGIPQTMNLKNNDAEAGLAGWEVFGAVERHGQFNAKYEGDQAWWGGADVDAAQANIPYSYMWQDVEVFDVWISEVDAGTTSIQVSWYQSSAEWEDKGNIRVEFLNSAKTVIGSDNGAGLTSIRNGGWSLRYFHAGVPVNTRYVRVIPEFALEAGENNNALIDYIRLEIYKGNIQNNRSFGPDFKKWRINFTRMNNYSGAALSELEMRDSISGTDLCTGGTVIAGSEGIGGLASYAFDDLRNTGYWAGEGNAIALGTAWLGYAKPSDWRPVELDITARSDVNSLQVGRDFTLQGAGDDDIWTDVQRFVDIGDFTSGQRKQFVVASGTKPYTQDQIQTDAGKTTRTENNIERPTFGVIYEARTRMNITHLRAYWMQSGVENTMTIAKINYEHDPDGAIVDFENVGETVVGSDTTGEGYVEVALLTDFIVEVGDHFCVLATDLNTPDGDSRIGYFASSQKEPPDTYYSEWLMGMRSTDTVIAEGTPNNSPTSDLIDVDFRGTIF